MADPNTQANPAPARVARALPRTVVVLGLASLLNDAASDMIAPLLPLFLTLTLGAGPAVVGLIEGLAEATASLLKLVSGWLADRGWRAKRLVVGGYLVSNIARPLIGLALGWGGVLALRFLDRIGKGLRTAPRDAMIAAAADLTIRGRAFGFHRAMDHAGAMLGPLIAFALLQTGMELRDVFLLSVVPGLLVVLLLGFGLVHTPAAPAVSAPLRWRALDGRVRSLILASGGLALATAPEAFLILWAQGAGIAIVWVPLLWAAAHAIRAALATPAGVLSDRLGRLPVVTAGWSMRIALLVLFALFQDGELMIWLLFLLYAAATAFSEAAERALIGDFAPAAQRATAFGLYHLVVGVLALPGALLFGGVWQMWDKTGAFLMAAVLTALSAAALVWMTRRRVN